MQHKVLEEKYKKNLEDSIKSYQEEKESIERSIHSLKSVTELEEKRLNEITKSIESVRSELDQLQNIEITQEDNLTDVSDKIDTIQENDNPSSEIEKLKEARERITDALNLKDADKKEPNLLERLSEKDIMVGEKQQAILINKTQKMIFIDHLRSRFDVPKKEAEAEEKEEASVEQEQAVSNSHETDQKIARLSVLQNSNDISYFGATTMVIDKNDIKKMTDKLTIAKMNATPSIESTENFAKGM